MEKCLAIDLGGTNLRIALVAEDGKILQTEKTAVLSERSPLDVIAQIKRLSEKIDKEKITALAAGIPGIVNSSEGIVYKSPHFPDWNDVPMADLLGKAFNSLPVTIDNDVNRAAIGELWLGAGKSLSNFIMITLGTGIGGGIVIDQKLMHGDEGLAGEIGHMIIKEGGRACPCGNRGCWEMYAAKSSLKYYCDDQDSELKSKFLEPFDGQIERLNLEELNKLASKGFKPAAGFWNQFGFYLSVGIGSLMSITGIYSIIIGGNIAKAWEHFSPSLKENLSKHTYKQIAAKANIAPATLGEQAGLLGSAYSAFHLLACLKLS